MRGGRGEDVAVGFGGAGGGGGAASSGSGSGGSGGGGSDGSAWAALAGALGGGGGGSEGSGGGGGDGAGLLGAVRPLARFPGEKAVCQAERFRGAFRACEPCVMRLSGERGGGGEDAWARARGWGAGADIGKRGAERGEARAALSSQGFVCW